MWLHIHSIKCCQTGWNQVLINISSFLLVLQDNSSHSTLI